MRGLRALPSPRKIDILEFKEISLYKLLCTMDHGSVIHHDDNLGECKNQEVDLGDHVYRGDWREKKILPNLTLRIPRPVRDFPCNPFQFEGILTLGDTRRLESVGRATKWSLFQVPSRQPNRRVDSFLGFSFLLQSFLSRREGIDFFK